MTVLPPIFPFSGLKLRNREVLRWVGYNPTFHRYSAYGLAISDAAFYVCSRGWLFARWKRYPLPDISDVTFDGDENTSAIKFRVGDKQVTFRTPCDAHHDETEFDRGVLSQAVKYLRS